MNLKCALNEALQKQPDIYEYIESCHVNEDTVCDITKYSSSVTNDVLNYALSFENPKFALVQQILTKLKQDNKQDNNKEICELIAASYLKTSEKIKLITTNNNLKDELNSQNVDGTTPMMILLNNIDFDKDSEEIDKIAAFFTDLDLTQENNNGNDGFSILNNLLVKLMNSYADELSKNYVKTDNEETKITETNTKLKKSIKNLATKNLN